jgi:thiamine-monophosphate kinase
VARARSGEFALIDSFLAPFHLDRSGGGFARSSGVLVGPGDDCAQLAPARGMTLVATTDAALDGVHFDLSRSSTKPGSRALARDAGWKALAMNLSDLAAAGAKPRWFLCALGVPWLAEQDLHATARNLGRGMARLAKESECALVGGNVTKARQWSLTITALGEAQKPLSRAGATPGDQLFLVGELGAAALGLQLLESRKAKLGASERACVAAQLRPAPQITAGQIAARFASAAIDISDGLLQDLGHLCARSGVGAAIDCDALPRSIAVKRAEEEAAKNSGAHPFALSLAGGEEYALLLAVPKRRTAKLLAALDAHDLKASRIGEVTRAREISLRQGDRAVPLPARLGHDHLR